MERVFIGATRAEATRMADDWWAHQKKLRQTLRTRSGCWPKGIRCGARSMGHNHPLREREPQAIVITRRAIRSLRRIGSKPSGGIETQSPQRQSAKPQRVRDPDR